MTHVKIIIGIGVIIGLLLFKKTEPNILKVFLAGFALSYGIGFFVVWPLGTIAFISFGFLLLGFTIWSVINKRWISLIIGLFGTLSFIWGILDYPFWNLLQFSMIIPLTCYGWTLFKRKEYLSEISVLTILASFELTEFLNYFGQWIN